MPCQREEENHDRAELESRMRDFEKLIGGGEESDVNFEIPRVQTMGERPKTSTCTNNES